METNCRDGYEAVQPVAERDAGNEEKSQKTADNSKSKTSVKMVKTLLSPHVEAV